MNTGVVSQRSAGLDLPHVSAEARAPLHPVEVNALYSLLIADAREYAIFMLDPDGLVTTWQAGAESIKGYEAHEIVGRHFSVFYPAAEIDAGTPERNLAQAVRDGRAQSEGWRVRKDGSQFWARNVTTAIFDDAGQLRGFGKVTRDLTDRNAAEEETLRRSLHDELTNLPNRALFTERLEAALAAHEGREGSLALVFIDIDQFKSINDTYGHAAGDVVLVKVARRLVTAVRPGDTIARIGGDEFVALCDNVAGQPAARAIVDRLIAALVPPMSVPAGRLVVSASIGTALTDRNDVTAERMMVRADAAMDVAKKLGGPGSRAHIASDDDAG